MQYALEHLKWVRGELDAVTQAFNEATDNEFIDAYTYILTGLQRLERALLKELGV